MLFNNHSNLAGRHAFLSPSNYHWINYTDDHLEGRFLTAMAAQRGTELHDFAHKAINLGIKLPGNGKTLSLYVNDGIGYRMRTEQVLKYSDNCFGSADTLSFRKNKLRIHDLKTGVNPSSFHQLEIYAALFCLEYRFKPFDIGMELRIYQSDEVQVIEPEANDIVHIMEKIKHFDRQINEMRLEALS